MPLLLLLFHPSVHQLLLKAEGIRSNPNFSLLTTLADVPRLVKSGQLWGERGGGGGGCLSELVIPLCGSHQARGDALVQGHVPAERWAGGWKTVCYCLIRSTQLASLEELVR